MKKILFRADAAPHIGIGDLMSLIHLSNYLDEEWEVFFIIKNYKAGVNLCKKYRISPTVISEAIEIEQEVQFINNFIQENSIDIIFFEITERGLSDYHQLSNNVKKICVSFDGDILKDMDLVIDWDTEAEKFHEPKKYRNTTYLLGHKYVILPKSFYSIDYSKNFRNSIPKNILIAMGGADEYDFTSKVVESIGEISQKKFNLKIIVGSGYNHRDRLNGVLDKFKFQNTSIVVNSDKMLEEYLSCDFAIGAGGLTVSELVATRTPSFIVATYEHQIHRCKTFEDEGYIAYSGYRHIDKKKLNNSLSGINLNLDKDIFQTNKIVEMLNYV